VAGPDSQQLSKRRQRGHVDADLHPSKLTSPDNVESALAAVSDELGTPPLRGRSDPAGRHATEP
jgi:hypothetical protein